MNETAKQSVVINRKTTKFESNWQHKVPALVQKLRCYQSQNYKIWKQFTTLLLCSSKTSLLLSITKLQNLKTIHNHTLTLNLKRKVVINRRTTKFESNSQLVTACDNRQQRCYQSQNYKFWKQFITPKASQIWAKLLLSITKLQILKAIHNYLWCKNISILVVINHKTTKFESNSQQGRQMNEILECCYQS